MGWNEMIVKFEDVIILKRELDLIVRFFILLPFFLFSFLILRRVKVALFDPENQKILSTIFN